MEFQLADLFESVVVPLKLYVPSQCHSFGIDELAVTRTRRRNPASVPVPSEIVHSPTPVAKRRRQWPVATLPRFT